MGRKVHPKVFRLQTVSEHTARWFSKKDFSKLLERDIRIRAFLQKKLRGAGLAKIEIERKANELTVVLYTSKTGMVIGRGGKGIEAIKREIKDKFVGAKEKLNLSIQDVARPELDAELVSQNIIEQLEKRIPFRRAIKRVIEQVQTAGANGVKVIVKGRLNGAEIARSEMFMDGNLPLQSLRADIDYAQNTAFTTYGTVGVKVWIYRGDIFDTKKEDAGTEVGSTVK